MVASEPCGKAAVLAQIPQTDERLASTFVVFISLVIVGSIFLIAGRVSASPHRCTRLALLR
jgi:hypothetical protein